MISKIAIAGGILTTGLLIQVACSLLTILPFTPVLPAFGCIAPVILQVKGSNENEAKPDYTKTVLIGVIAGLLFMPFAGNASAAVAGIVACIVGALAALMVCLEMTKKAESFSPMFSAFTGSLISGIFIMTAGLAGAAFTNPSLILREFIGLIVVSLLAGIFCQGTLIFIKKSNNSD